MVNDRAKVLPDIEERSKTFFAEQGYTWDRDPGGPGLSVVTSPDRSAAYLVRLDGATRSCTCGADKAYGSWKHLLAMKRELDGAADTSGATRERSNTVTDKIVLMEPFDQAALKQRPGPGRTVFDYVQGGYVIARVIEATGNEYDWSLERVEMMSA